MTATTTKNHSRKPAKKPARSVQISNPVNGCFALAMTVGAGKATKRYGYFLEPLAADFGRGFRFVKFETETDEPAEYCVNIDANGFHSCECAGFLRWNHCKHVESLLALIKSGKIQ